MKITHITPGTGGIFYCQNCFRDSELLKVLAEIDISVPRRSEGRTKDHTERYAIAHLLSALVGKDRISPEIPINYAILQG